ncbi:hypothetical protein NGRA_2323 [Nosema granulosis]|uniref:Uncharacterized protein n=1 Tax=Nosema granulosis TaxID=83296 RepID=A0A9P6KXU1_9MICR|nr:hypothetical protein NGRA_2323 [Nosema granulosis]
MAISIKNIRKSGGVSNCTTIEVDNTRYIVLNRTDSVEIYNHELEFVQTVDFVVYINLINTVNIENKEYLVLFTTQDTYFFFESKLIFDIQNLDSLESRPLSNQFKLDQSDVYNSSVYKYSKVFKDILLVFTTLGDVLIYNVKKEGLFLDDFPNDFKYFDILDVSSDGVYLVFLVKDIEDNVSVLKYYSEDGRLLLKNKISREDSIRKKSAGDGILLDGIKNLDILRNGYLSIGKNVIIYEDGETITSEFANTFVKSKCHFGNKMLYAMEDGELIQVEILNKKTNRSRSTQTVNSTNTETGKIEKSDKKINIAVLHKFSQGLKFLKVVSKNLVVIGSNKAVELIKIENQSIECLNKIKCTDGIEGETFYDGKYYVWDSKKIFKVSYSLEASFLNISKMENTIHKFIFFGNILILGYNDRGVVIRNNSDHILETGRILNISKEVSTKKVYFNTRNNIYIIDEKANSTSMECSGIILSSYFEEKVLIYTLDRKIKLINLKSKSIEAEKTIEYEISTLLLWRFPVFSTYEGHFVVLKSDLSILLVKKQLTFNLSVSLKGRSFFSTCGDVYELLKDQENVLFRRIYSSDSTISSLSSIEDSLLVISNDSVLLNLKKSTKHRISISGISGGCFDGNYHFSKGRKIISCLLGESPVYNYYLHKSTKSKRRDFCNIVLYLPKKEMVIFSNSIENTTVLTKNNIDVLEIQNFYSTKAVCFGSSFVIAGYYKSTSFIISLAANSTGEIYNIENDDRVKILYQEQDEVVKVHGNINSLLISNSHSIRYYEKNFNHPVEIKLDCTIHEIYYYDGYILVLDYFRSFILVDISTGSVISSPNLIYKFYCGLLTEKYAIVSTRKDLFVFDRGSMEIIFQQHIGSFIVGIESKTLDMEASESIYIFTSDSSIFCLNLNCC